LPLCFSSFILSLHCRAIGAGAVSIGGAIVTVAVTLIQNDSQGVSTEYVVATYLLLVSAIIFIIDRRFYLPIEPHESVMVECIPVLANVVPR
jgi:hypothetical protein